MRHPSSPLTPKTLQVAIDFVYNHKTPTVLIRRVEQVVSWMRSRNPTTIMFTLEYAPLNTLVTLALHSQDEWERVKGMLLEQAEKATWKDHTTVDRREYMRQYMRDRRAGAKVSGGDQAPAD